MATTNKHIAHKEQRLLRPHRTGRTLAAVVFIAVAWLGSITPTTSTAHLMLIPSLTNSLAATGFWIAIFWAIAALIWLFAGNLHHALAESRKQMVRFAQLRTPLKARVAAQTAELAQRTERAEALSTTLDLHQVLNHGEQATRMFSFASSAMLVVEPEHYAAVALRTTAA